LIQSGLSSTLGNKSIDIIILFEAIPKTTDAMLPEDSEMPRNPGAVNSALSDKLKAIIEVSIVEAVFFVVAWYLQAIHQMQYGWYSKTVMIILGFAGILIHRKSRNYRILPRNLRFSVKWATYTILLFAIIDVIIVLASLLMAPRLRINLRALIIDAIWFFLFVGFSEELFFRGYVQSRLNEVFTHKYEKILGVDFKWSRGTLITGVVFFGIPHILTGINPFTGRAFISPVIVMVTLFACFLGIIFGVLREKTGGIILPTILHSLIDFTVYGIGRIVGLALSNIAAGVAIFLFLAISFQKILKEQV